MSGFGLKQGQGFKKTSTAHLYPNVSCSPPWGRTANIRRSSKEGANRAGIKEEKGTLAFPSHSRSQAPLRFVFFVLSAQFTVFPQ